MTKLRIIVISGVLPLVVALALALPGCGGGGPAPNPDGTVPTPPGTVDLSNESPNMGKAVKKAK